MCNYQQNNNMKAIIMSATLIAATAVLTQARTIDYPDARRVDTVDTYFGTPVPDPQLYFHQGKGQISLRVCIKTR